MGPMRTKGKFKILDTNSELSLVISPGISVSLYETQHVQNATFIRTWPSYRVADRDNSHKHCYKRQR
jgi:hypothetical protein